MKNLRILALIALALCFGLGQLRAQSFASITGTVTDQTGAVVPGVSILLQNPSTGVEYKGESNSDASYTISNVQPGPGYKITFTGAGFQPVVITGMYLNVNTTSSGNSRLAATSSL